MRVSRNNRPAAGRSFLSIGTVAMMAVAAALAGCQGSSAPARSYAPGVTSDGGYECGLFTGVECQAGHPGSDLQDDVRGPNGARFGENDDPSQPDDETGEGIARQMCTNFGGYWDSAANNCVQP